MRKKKKHTLTHLEVVETIIKESSETKSISKELSELIQQWLADDVNAEDKEKVLQSFFESDVKYRRNPSKRTIDALPDLLRRLGYEVASDTSDIKRPLYKKLPLRIAATAAVVLVVLGIGYVFTKNYNPGINDVAVAEVLLETPVGGIRTIILPDGSEVELKESSVFSYNENFLDDRTVFLDGEAYFKVTNRDGVPFSVKSDALSVTVLGTEFNIKTYSEDATAEVKLTKGKVSVSADGAESGTVLVPGQHMVYDKEHGSIELYEIEEAELMKLRNLSLEFNGENVEYILNGISRYFDVAIKIQEGMDFSENNLFLDLTGNETLDDALFILQNISGGFNYEIVQDTVVITKINK